MLNEQIDEDIKKQCNVFGGTFEENKDWQRCYKTLMKSKKTDENKKVTVEDIVNETKPKPSSPTYFDDFQKLRITLPDSLRFWGGKRTRRRKRSSKQKKSHKRRAKKSHRSKKRRY